MSTMIFSEHYVPTTLSRSLSRKNLLFIALRWDRSQRGSEIAKRKKYPAASTHVTKAVCLAPKKNVQSPLFIFSFFHLLLLLRLIADHSQRWNYARYPSQTSKNVWRRTKSIPFNPILGAPKTDSAPNWFWNPCEVRRENGPSDPFYCSLFRGWFLFSLPVFILFAWASPFEGTTRGTLRYCFFSPCLRNFRLLSVSYLEWEGEQN